MINHLILLVCSIRVLCYIYTVYCKLFEVEKFHAGLHLGNDSRGGKIRFYESKGGQWCKDLCV